MAGLYSHTTRAVGITLTANIYNSDHTNHITNHITTQMDDYSSNIAQMRTVTDATGGSLATSLAGELERLRDNLLRLHPTSTYWYEQPPVFRSIGLRLQPGATPGTNINATVLGGTFGYNLPSTTDTTDLAKSGSGGSFALDADGKVLTFDITENITGVLGATVSIHDLNTSSTTEMYTVQAQTSSNNLNISLIKRGTSANVDLTTILDAGDLCDVLIPYVTAT